MEEEGIGLVLARATELRFKITNCIHHNSKSSPNPLDADDDEDADDDATDRLINICDALEALETQLSSLQVLPSQNVFFLLFIEWNICHFIYLFPNLLVLLCYFTTCMFQIWLLTCICCCLFYCMLHLMAKRSYCCCLVKRF